MVEPTKTMPFATAGDDEMVPDAPIAPDGSMTAVHNGVQVLGTPAQLVTPVESNASSWPSSEVTKAVPEATAGEE